MIIKSYLGLFLIWLICVLQVSTAQYDCSDKHQTVQEGDDVKLYCTFNNWIKTCELRREKSQLGCVYNIKYLDSKYTPVKDPDNCSLNNTSMYEFDGYNCQFKVQGLSKEDAGQWILRGQNDYNDDDWKTHSFNLTVETAEQQAPTAVNCSEKIQYTVVGGSVSLKCDLNGAVDKCELKKRDQSECSINDADETCSNSRFNYTGDNSVCGFQLTDIQTSDNTSWSLLISQHGHDIGKNFTIHVNESRKEGRSLDIQPQPETLRISGFDSCSGQSPVDIEGSTVTLTCKLPQYKYMNRCILRKGRTFETSTTKCDIMTRGSETSCSSSSRVKYSGDNYYNCGFDLENLKMEDDGKWFLEAYIGNSGADTDVYRQSFNLEVKKDISDNNGPNVPTTPQRNTTGCYDIGYKYEGGEYIHIEYPVTPDKCQDKCMEDDGCYFWTFEKKPGDGNGDCHLNKEELALKNRTRINIKFTSGPKQCHGCFQFGIGIGPGKKLYSNYDPLSETVYDCQAECVKYAPCNMFTWNSRNKKCYLKTGLTTYTHDHQFVSANRTCESREEEEEEEEGGGETTTETNGADEDDGTLKASPEKGVLVGWLLGLVAVVVVGVALASIFFLKRKRGGNSKVVQREQPFIPATDLSQGQALVVEKKPLPVDTFASKVYSGEIPVKDEYTLMENWDTRLNTSKKRTIAEQNECLNRYRNIWPYNDNRVVLQSPINRNDYINASWIHSCLCPIESIAAQGPMGHTLVHFLQMVVENKMEIVVMLTKLVEMKNDVPQQKCDQYWADVSQGKVQIGHMLVKTIGEKTMTNVAGVTIRQLVIQDCRNGRIQSVTHYHYTDWPDFGVPDTGHSLLALVREVRDTKVGKVLVHCSAGVGRTGTFLALCHIVNLIENGANTIDVFTTVLDQRRDRCRMVQQEAQYIFLYQCIAAYLKQRNPGTSSFYVQEPVYYME